MALEVESQQRTVSVLLIMITVSGDFVARLKPSAVCGYHPRALSVLAVTVSALLLPRVARVSDLCSLGVLLKILCLLLDECFAFCQNAWGLAVGSEREGSLLLRSCQSFSLSLFLKIIVTHIFKWLACGNVRTDMFISYSFIFQLAV